MHMLFAIFMTIIMFSEYSHSSKHSSKLRSVSVSESSYNITESKSFDVYSASTFCTYSQITTWTCTICKKVEKPIQVTVVQNIRTNVRGFVGYLPTTNRIIIAFRGTKDIKNWLQDLSFQLVQYRRCDGCLIHAGWYADFFSIEAQLTVALRKITQKYSKTKVIVTGSSLGGSLAMVTGIELQSLYGNVQEVHVFGCPRVGNQAFAKFVNQRIPNIWRVVHDHDIVPHVPLVNQNYHHSAFQVLFDQNMDKFTVCDQSGEDPNCSDSYAPAYSITDHITYWEQPVRVDVCNS